MESYSFLGGCVDKNIHFCLHSLQTDPWAEGQRAVKKERRETLVTLLESLLILVTCILSALVWKYIRDDIPSSRSFHTLSILLVSIISSLLVQAVVAAFQMPLVIFQAVPGSVITLLIYEYNYPEGEICIISCIIATILIMFAAYA
jgi:hypothetical protein